MVFSDNCLVFKSSSCTLFHGRYSKSGIPFPNNTGSISRYISSMRLSFKKEALVIHHHASTTFSNPFSSKICIASVGVFAQIILSGKSSD